MPGQGMLQLPSSIPNTPSLVGGNLNLQALFLDPGAPGKVAMTNGVELWFG